jgi:cysteinyl-tRNA synthetase
MESYRTLMALFTNVPTSDSPLAKELEAGIQDAFNEMDDDFNVPNSLARLFELCTTINKIADSQLSVDDAGQYSLDMAKKRFKNLPLTSLVMDEADSLSDDHMAQLDGLMQFIIDMRQYAREQRLGTDKIRDTLARSILIEKMGKKEEMGFQKITNNE